MDEEGKELLRETNRKLGVLVALLANALPVEEKTISIKEQIKLLNQYGLRPSEIAVILNKSPNHISKELTLLRSSKK
jgi:sulfur carrier protein ThiS